MRADRKLEQLGVGFELLKTDEEVHTCEEAARARDIETSQVVKSLIVERNGEYIHVCIPGDRTLSEKKFGEHNLVEPEKSKELTGFESGTVHPLSTDLKHVVDERVFQPEKVSFTVGNRHEGVLLDSKHLRKVFEDLDFELEVKDLAVVEQRDIDRIVQKGVDQETARFIAKKGYRKDFDRLVENHSAEEAANVIEKLNREEVEFEPEQAAKIIERSENDTHMQKLAEQLAEKGKIEDDVEDFVLEELVEKTVEDEPKAVEDYRAGKESAINYLLGQVMQGSNGRADAGKATEIIREKIDD